MKVAAIIRGVLATDEDPPAHHAKTERLEWYYRAASQQLIDHIGRHFYGNAILVDAREQARTGVVARMAEHSPLSHVAHLEQESVQYEFVGNVKPCLRHMASVGGSGSFGLLRGG